MRRNVFEVAISFLKTIVVLLAGLGTVTAALMVYELMRAH